MTKRLLTGIAAGVLSCQMGAAALAGQWKSDASGWWYDNGNGTYPVNCWQWIDGNNDGTEECYYFGPDGYCLQNGRTPDGFQVNEYGAWVKDGSVQIRKINQEGTNSQEKNYILSKRQIKVLEKVLSNITCLNAHMEPLEMKDLSTDDLNYLIANIMNDEMYCDNSQDDSDLIFDQYIVLPDQRVRHFDKQDVFKKMEDLYGHPIVESMLYDTTFDTAGQTIFIGGGAGDCSVIPKIIDYKVENSKLYLSFSYEINYVVPELNTSGNAMAVFRENPNSFIGFTLERIGKE